MTFLRRINHPQSLQEGLHGLISNDTYSDTALLCSDGKLVHNKLTVGLLFPLLGNCTPFLLPVPATLMLPDHTVSEVQARVADIFGHLNLSLDSLIEQQLELTKANLPSRLSPKAFSCSFCCLTFQKLDLLVRHKKIHNVNNAKNVDSCVPGTPAEIVNGFITSELSSSKEENLSQLSVPKDLCLDGLLWNDDHEKHSIDPCKTKLSYNTEDDIQEHHKSYDSHGENDDIDDTMSDDGLHNSNDALDVKFEPVEKRLENKSTQIKRRKETGDKSYSCSYCGKSFPSQGPMLIHERTHTKEYPYACNYCHRKFNQSWHVKVHERIHTGERPFMCSDCGKCFASNSTLTSHKVLHRQDRPHKCKFCEKGFNHLSGLRSHENLHTGEEQYMCSECGKTYNNKKNLNRHHCKKDGDNQLKAESGSDEKFMCLECGKEYKTKKILRRHKCARSFQLSSQTVGIR